MGSIEHPPVAVVSALDRLVDGVRAYFDEHKLTAMIAAGWREPTKQANQGPGRANRILFVLRGFKYGPAMQPGRNRRPVATRLDNVELRVWAYDPEAPNDEAKQLAAASWLQDQLDLALHEVAHGTFSREGGKPEANKTERVFGCELVSAITLQHAVRGEGVPEASDVEPSIVNVLVLSGGDVVGCSNVD